MVIQWAFAISRKGDGDLEQLDDDGALRRFGRDDRCSGWFRDAR